VPGSGEARIYEMFLADRADASEASPVRLVAGNETPFFLAFGDNDFARIVRSNEQMAAALRKEDCALHVETLVDCGHFDTALSLGDSDWRQRRGS